MSRQSQLFFALICYFVLVALPFLEIARLPVRYEPANPSSCTHGTLFVEGACARGR